AHDSEPVQATQGRVLELRAPDRDRQRGAAEPQCATVRFRDVDPVDAKLELVIERYGVKSGFDLDLTVNSFVHAGEVMRDSVKRGGPVSDLYDAGGFVDRQGTFACRSQHEAEFFSDFPPEIDRVVRREVHGRAAAAE